jgi:hypothetical protein
MDRKYMKKSRGATASVLMEPAETGNSLPRAGRAADHFSQVCKVMRLLRVGARKWLQALKENAPPCSVSLLG